MRQRGGTSFEKRALPPSNASSRHIHYEVTRLIPEVSEGRAIPWFGQIGLGTQFKLALPVEDLLKNGYLRRVVTSPEIDNIVDQIFTNPNKVNNIVNGSVGTNHNWDALVPNKDPKEIADIIKEVIQYGEVVPYKTVDSKVLKVTRNGVTRRVQVPYDPDLNPFQFGDAWVME